jgi:HAD superfamily hydrolase (TIGR01490 family)
MPGRSAAFFDLDGTLIEGAISGYLLRHLVWMGRIPKRRLASMAGLNVLYKLNLLTPETVYKVAQEMVVGWSLEEIDRVMTSVMERVNRRVYAGAIERIEWHRAQGHLLAVVTGGPEHGARLLCERLAIPHVIGTRAPVRNGRITGEFSVADLCYGEGKVVRVHAFARQFDVDLAKSYAYSDSRSDLPLLQAVGHAHAVNPQWLLEREAQKHGMPVLRFREFAAWPAPSPATQTG